MARVVHIARATQPQMPWANGGGVTRQIAIEPPTASLASGFHWRVSQARVASDGPFSCLPGVDRSLWLLSGHGVRLAVEGREVVLARALQRFDFRGELAITASLLAGPIEDLNVMTARARGRAEANLLELASADRHPVAPAPQRLAVVLAGVVRCDGIEAVAGDALRCDGDELFELHCRAAPCRLLVCRFWSV